MNLDTHSECSALTHWGHVTHICVGKLTIIGSDNGLSPERRQAIIWTNVGILLIGPLGTNFIEILIEIQAFSLRKVRLKMSSMKCCSIRLGLKCVKARLHNDDDECNVQTNKYDLQTTRYPNICTHHRLHNNKNKHSSFPRRGVNVNFKRVLEMFLCYMTHT